LVDTAQSSGFVVFCKLVRLVRLFIILLITAGGLISYLFFVTIKTDLKKKQRFASTELTRASKYSSSVHNFSFSYSEPYQVIENSTEAFDVGTISGQMVHKSVGVRVLPIPAALTYDTFVINQAIETCNHSELTNQIRCTGLNEKLAFISDTGVSGFKFYLNAEVYSMDTLELLSKKRAGPFFALAIARDKYILLYPRLTEKTDINTRNLQYIIAETFSISP